MHHRSADTVTIALIGAGNRGADVYAAFLARMPERARVVAVAEPDPAKRERFAALHEVPEAQRFARWEDLLTGARLADALVIATPDRLHLAPSLRALELGYHVLLEKPIAPTLPEVLALAGAARASAGSITVAHVLRYSPFFATLKRLLAEGRIGRLVSVQHAENIGYWHFAHSYVRGNWRREAEAAPMILAKACHDLDLLRWLVDAPCVAVSSYGGLFHFRPENAPAGSSERCTGGCAVERRCPYSALRIYLERFGARPGWPNSVLTADPDRDSIRKALETGPYGRCVYRCDNDVADHQTVALEFAGGVTASVTVSAFTEQNTRTLHLMGTHGELRGHMGKGEITLYDFAAGRGELIRVPGEAQGHRQADEALVRDFVVRLERAKAGEMVEDSLTTLDASIESHLMAFAAELSRASGQGVRLAELYEAAASPLS